MTGKYQCDMIQFWLIEANDHEPRPNWKNQMQTLFLKNEYIIIHDFKKELFRWMKKDHDYFICHGVVFKKPIISFKQNCNADIKKKILKAINGKFGKLKNEGFNTAITILTIFNNDNVLSIQNEYVP